MSQEKFLKLTKWKIILTIVLCLIFLLSFLMSGAGMMCESGGCSSSISEDIFGIITLILGLPSLLFFIIAEAELVPQNNIFGLIWITASIIINIIYLYSISCLITVGWKKIRKEKIAKT